MLTSIVIYVLLGAFAGVLAGLLGVGGGLVIVPMLVIAFEFQNFPPELIMHLALGTSLASIMFTSVSSASSHHKRGAVIWQIVKYITPGILIGTYLGTCVASNIPAYILQIIFSTFLFYVSYQMIMGKNPKASRQMPGFMGTSLAGSGIGIISSLVGIGGGTISVPFMVLHNIEIRKAIGTSSAIGIPIAIAGCLGYLINGLNVENLPTYSIGYIYLPALCGIVVCSILTAPIGARLAHTLPVFKIKRIFAILLLAVGLEMLITAFN